MATYTKKNDWFDPNAVSTRIHYGPILRFLEYLKPVRGKIAFAAILSLAFSSVAYLIPQVFSYVERALTDEDTRLLVFSLGAYFGIMSFQSGARYLVTRTQASVFTQLSEIALMDYYRQVLNLRVPEFLQMRQTSNLFQRVIDVMNMTRTFTSIIVFGVLNIVSVVIFGVVIATIAWPLLVVLAVGGVLMAAYVLGSTPHLRRLHSLVLGANYPLVSRMLEIINGMLTIKALTASIGVTRDVRTLVERRRQTQYDEVVYEARIDTLLSVLQTTSIVMAVGVGFYLYLHGQLALSGLFAAYVLMGAFLQPVQGIARQYRELSKLSVNLKNYYEVLDMPSETPAAHALAAAAPTGTAGSVSTGDGDPRAVPALAPGRPLASDANGGASSATRAPKSSQTVSTGRVTFKDVAFEYRPGQPVLRGVSFDVSPGERVALIGRSGAGKTTLFRLLLGFLKPQSGQLLVDGCDVATHDDLNAYRKRFGIVSQSDFLFNISIRENLSIGYEEASDEALADALEAVNLWNDVSELESGLDQVHFDDKMSGGQRQRLLVARALVRQPDIVLLDEPTSSLDFENEREIMRSLDTLVSGKTALIIAHRLSTVQQADRVLVLNKGQIVGDGTHKALYEENDYYRALCDFNSVIV